MLLPSTTGSQARASSKGTQLCWVPPFWTPWRPKGTAEKSGFPLFSRVFSAFDGFRGP